MKKNYKESKKHNSKRKKKNKLLKRMFILCMTLFLFLIVLLISKPGRNMVYDLAGEYLINKMTTKNENKEFYTGLTHTANLNARKEDYVTNFLLLGIESINGGNRTDSMMIASINTKDNSIKIISLLRDTYVQIPNYKAGKLNSAYEKGGVQTLVDTIELNFAIYIDGYAFVNFENFEQIIDRLGGVEIELGEKEANYLNRTNYISNPKYRTVKAGLQTLNGNQALGYCRIRKVETLGGAQSDYGRTLRQRRLMRSIFEKYKSKNIVELVRILNDCLKYINTNLTADQMKKIISDIVENKITTMDSERVPINGAFKEEKNYKGVGDVLVPDYEKNIQALYEFIYLDGVELEEEVNKE